MSQRAETCIHKQRTTTCSVQFFLFRFIIYIPLCFCLYWSVRSTKLHDTNFIYWNGMACFNIIYFFSTQKQRAF